jgi:excisionase family DNA binding protein
MSATAFHDFPEVTRSTPHGQLPEWLSVREASAYTGMSTWAIYEGVHRGEIPHRRMGPKVILIPKEFFDPSRAQKTVTP